MEPNQGTPARPGESESDLADWIYGQVDSLSRRLEQLERSNATSLSEVATNLFESEWILRTYATLLVLSVPQWPALSGIDLLHAFELGRRAQQLAMASLAGYQTALAEFQKSQEAV